MDIKQFLASPAFAVVGVSANRTKYGNKVLRCYMQHNKIVYPVHPREQFIEGLACIHKISDLPATVKSLSMVTPPAITEMLVDEAIKKGIKNIWMQPGAESGIAILNCKRHGVNIIANGPCILIELGFKD